MHLAPTARKLDSTASVELPVASARRHQVVLKPGDQSDRGEASGRFVLTSPVTGESLPIDKTTAPKSHAGWDLNSKLVMRAPRRTKPRRWRKSSRNALRTAGRTSEAWGSREQRVCARRRGHRWRPRSGGVRYEHALNFGRTIGLSLACSFPRQHSPPRS